MQTFKIKIFACFDCFIIYCPVFRVKKIFVALVTFTFMAREVCSFIFGHQPDQTLWHE